MHARLVHGPPGEPLVQGKAAVLVRVKGAAGHPPPVQARLKLVAEGEVHLVKSGYPGVGQVQHRLVEAGEGVGFLVEDVPAAVSQGQIGARGGGIAHLQGPQEAVLRVFFGGAQAGEASVRGQRKRDEPLLRGVEVIAPPVASQDDLAAQAQAVLHRQGP
jgi:hypothetical protein